MFAAALGQPAANNEINAPVGLHLIQNNVRFVFELGQHLSGFVENFTVVRAYLDNVTEVNVLHRGFKYQRTRVLHGVEENRRNLVADTDAPGSLVWYA